MNLAKILAIAAAMHLAACATPSTQRPGYSQGDVANERAYQQEVAQSQPAAPTVGPVRVNKAMKERVQAIANRIAPEANKLCYTIRNDEEESCNFNIQLKEQDELNAYADGDAVVLSTPMVDFAAEDTHLAFVMAHEFAHNIMRHIQSQTTNVLIGTVLGTLADYAASSQGASTGGAFSKLGANMGELAYSPAFEQEADYIGLYILARAGYKIERAPDFWREMSRTNSRAITVRSTHPTNPERFVAMQKTIEEIRAKQKHGQPLLPNIVRN